jgi:hypothetical protein
MNTIFLHLRTFAHEHDELPAFHAGYLVLTLLAAAMFNLGTFAFLILVHMCLDIVKYREVHSLSWSDTFYGSMRESLIDVTLLSVGLVFAVYFHHTVGVAGMSGLMRAEITIVRLLGTTIPKMKILHNFLKVMAHLRHYLSTLHPEINRGWSSADKLNFFFIGIALVLLIFAPIFLHTDSVTIQKILLGEMMPFRM